MNEAGAQAGVAPEHGDAEAEPVGERRDSVIEVLRMLATGEHDQARLYAPLVTGARDGSMRLAFAGIVRDELRHALVAERLLRRVGADDEADALAAPREDEAAALERASVQSVPVVEELDALVLCFLLDRAAAHRLADLAWCSWAPLARAARSMLVEEQAHVALGNHHVRGLAASPSTRAAVQSTIERWYGAVVSTFGIDDDERDQRWMQHGVRTRRVSDLRDEYVREVHGLATSWKLTLPPWTPPWRGQAHAVAAATARHHVLVGG